MGNKQRWSPDPAAILEYLTDGPSTATAIALNLGAHGHATSTALSTLAFLGIVVRQGRSSWAITPRGDMLRATLAERRARDTLSHGTQGLLPRDPEATERKAHLDFSAKLDKGVRHD